MSFSEFHFELDLVVHRKHVITRLYHQRESRRGLYELENELLFLLFDQNDLDQNNSFNPSIQMSNPYEWEWKQSFHSVFENENKEEEEDESSYFISSNKSEEITPEIVSCCQIKKNPFKVKKIDTSEELLQKKTKRGRKTDPDGKPALKIHEKTDIDNIITVVQINFINFIVDAINLLLLKHGIKDQFIRISHKVKKNVKISNFENLKTKKLSDILLLQISPKFRSYEKDHNKHLLEAVKDMEEIKDILNENYLKFFQEVYYKSERIININGKTISLFGKNLKMYKNKIAEFEDQEYVEIFDKYVNDKYFGN
jgi:hypothetical protein